MRDLILFSFLLIGAVSGLKIQQLGDCSGTVLVTVSGGAEKFCPTLITDTFEHKPIPLHNNAPSMLDGWTPPEFIGGIYLQGEHGNDQKQTVTFKSINPSLHDDDAIKIFVFYNNGTGYEWRHKNHDWTGNLGETLSGSGFQDAGQGPPYDYEMYLKSDQTCSKWPDCHGVHSKMWKGILSGDKRELSVGINKYSDNKNFKKHDGVRKMGAVYGIVVAGACNVRMEPQQNVHSRCPTSLSVRQNELRLSLLPDEDIEFQNPALDGWTSMDGSKARMIVDSSTFVKKTSDKQEQCTDMNNYVMPGAFKHPKGNQRKYSVMSPSSAASELLNQKDCRTIDELLTAVKNGQRVNANGVSLDWTEPSYFIPHGCNIPYHTPDQVSRVLTKPAVVEIHGDSLTRHMVLGMTLLLTGNFYDGGTAHASGWEQCTCDGLFSENPQCRPLANPEPAMQILPNKTCVENDDAPRIFWLQGGPHFKSNPQKTIREYFKPTMERIRSSYAKCKVQPTFLITGLNAQSRTMDKKYNHQSRENAMKFNDVVRQEFAADDTVKFVDFFNMTQDAMSCEGYHYLTDVNVAKANTFLALVDFLSK